MVDIDLTEIQSLDPKEIITHKLDEAKKKVNGAVLVEDQYMHIDCLNGLPGPMIKWFLKTLGIQGIAELVHKYENHSASVSVILGYSDESGHIEYFDGTVHGKIVMPRGDNGFGWNQIFELDGSGKTFGEVTIEEKNKVSMRKVAYEKLAKYLGLEYGSRN